MRKAKKIKNMFSKEDFVLWRDLYSPEFVYKNELILTSSYAGMYQKIESEFLYSAIRAIKPLNIIEIGSYNGWTSYIILKALLKNGFKSNLLSYDILNNSNNIDMEGDISRRLIVGDVKETIKEEEIFNCDFIFIDAEHTEEFSKWYCEEILKNLKKDVIIFIHDWEGHLGDLDGEFAGVIKYGIETGYVRRIFNVMNYVIENNLSETEKVGYAVGDRSPTEICIKN